MRVTLFNVKAGDKVVLNEEGKRYINVNQTEPTISKFKSITHGIVLSNNPHKSYISVNWIDYKGKVIYIDWYIYRTYLDLYEG